MNAPQAAIAALQSIPVAAIAASRTNPRKHFDKVALDELTASVKLHGVMQPVLVRPLEHGYELVAGERRLRAAKAAELVEIPAMVRTLTDGEALELQVIENLQRSDLHPLEEAEGYEALQKLHGYGVDDLAAKVGKSRAYVYARLKLTALCKEAREAFYDGRLTPSTALLIARIPVASTQVQAVKSITQKDALGDVLSFRQAQGEIHRNFMLRLKEAPFDPKDAGLVKKAGTCGACPKRTGNQPELFGDVKDADVCTDPTCFASKREAHYAVLRKEAEAAGRRIISGKEAKAIDSGYGYIKGYERCDVDAQVYYGDKARKIAPLVKQLGIETELLERPTTKELIEVVSESAIKAAMRKAGMLKTEPKAPRKVRGEKKVQDGPDPEAIDNAIADAVRASAAKGLRDGDLVDIALHVVTETDSDAHFFDRWQLPKRTYGPIDLKLRAALAKLDPPTLGRLMLDAVIESHLGYGDGFEDPKGFVMGIALRHDVDTAAVKKGLVEKFNAAKADIASAAPAPGKQAAKKAAGKPKKSAAA